MQIKINNFKIYYILTHLDTGTWSSWNQFTECSKNCNGGIKTRNRVCKSDYGLEGQNIFCEGSFEDKEECNKQPCKSYHKHKSAFTKVTITQEKGLICNLFDMYICNC